MVCCEAPFAALTAQEPAAKYVVARTVGDVIGQMLDNRRIAMSSSIRTHYDHLQVAQTASEEVIKGAYKYLSQKHHPDKNLDDQAGAERTMRLINEAYAVLSDPQRRKEHDEWIQKESERMRAPPTYQRGHISTTQAHVGTTAAGEQHFLKRAWLMLLFVASLVMLLGVFPYQLIAGVWQWSYVLALMLWLGIGSYAYRSLFYPHLVADEHRQERDRWLAIKPNTLKGMLAGAAAGAGAFALFAVFVANGPKSQVNFDLVAFLFFVIAGSIVGALALRR